MLHRGGLIGCGFIANEKHLPALAKLQDRIELVAFCDLIEERAVKAASLYGVEKAAVYTDYRDLLAREDIDVVYVLTQNNAHCVLTVDALRAGKNVLCEKPMALNSKEAFLMCEEAEKSGKLLTIGYQNRYRLDSMYARRIAESGELGEIYLAQAHAIRRRGIPTWGVFLNREAQGGGALIDIGTHALDMTLWIMNNYSPKRVTGSVFYKLGKSNTAGNIFGEWDTEKMEVEDSAFGYIVMENGAVVQLGASWALNTLDTREQKVTLCGTLGGLDMNDGLCINGVKQGALVETRPILKQFGNPLTMRPESEADTEARMWLDALDGTGELIVKPRQAAVVTQILEAVYESSRTGKEVLLQQG